MKQNDSLGVLRLVVEQGFGNADMTVIDKVISDDCVEHQFGMKGGKEGLKKEIQSLDSAFSSRKYELMNYSVNDDIVWVHYIASGEHTGPFMGHEPTGKKFSIDVFDRAKVENGQVVEHWGVPDRFALLMQLGFLLPTPVK